MSEENVELLNRAYAALRANDIEKALSYVHPEIEWRSLILEIEGVFHGHDGVREWWAGLRSVFPDWNPEIVDVRDFGDRLVGHGRGTGSGASSAVGIDDDFWQVVEIRDGLIVCYHGFRTEQEALEAAGIDE